MEQYVNGDCCPCCGQKIQEKDEEWLRLFGRLCEAIGLEKETVLTPVDLDLPNPPPDAGLNPPVKPKK